VVLAIGHTASRDAYAALAGQGVAMAPKPYALGFRMEHPQALIDELQLGGRLAAGARPRVSWSTVGYRAWYGADVRTCSACICAGAGPPTRRACGGRARRGACAAARRAGAGRAGVQRGKGRLPVADYRLAADVADTAGGRRGVFSFCMCPGGQARLPDRVG